METASPVPGLMHAGRTYDFSDLEALVVDPGSYFRGLLTTLLRHFGFRKLHQVDEPEQALAELRQRPIDLVLTELAFDDGIETGLAFVRRLRRGEGGCDAMVPVIAITGHAERHQVLAARDAGITEFLAKPMSPERLFHRIAMVVDNPRAFVRAQDYIGPDRRRFVHYDYDGPERRREGADSDLAEPAGGRRLARAARTPTADRQDAGS
jgi:CheY-like chemotaxis protein